MNERGRYFSEGDYDILGVPLTDSDDELDWMGALPWSADKVGLIGCSSTAEWQLAVASRGNKALATFIPESFGAGVGRVGPYYEQGNWFRGGAVQMLFAPWLYDYGSADQGRPAQISRGHVAAGAGDGRQIVRSGRASADRSIGSRRCGICRRKTFWPRSAAGTASCRHHALRQAGMISARRTIPPGIKAACGMTACTSTSPASG